MRRLWLFLMIMFVVACKAQKRPSLDIAKRTVQKVFVHASKGDYDSLRVIFLSELLQKSNDDYLMTYFVDIRKITQVDGVPDQSSLNDLLFSTEDQDKYKATFIPKSTDSLYVDSVQFTFKRSIGFDKVLMMEVFNNDKMFDKIIIH